ncbi:MAG TPA: winged helix-turn-helix domain-containing protein [Candidatus Dorea intestinavium]|nr:winged helix-turn-helix domain-containing protein [Candidatus Dorea intestinavium]
MIFFVEDDENIRNLVIYTLEASGFEAVGFEDGETFSKGLKEHTPELILLDIMLPKEDGISILKRLKRDKNTAEIPVIMMTAKGEEYDKVLGLELGADDYITKPFGMMEFVSRVKAVLRRTKPKENKDKVINFNGISLNEESHEVKVGDEVIVLALKEYRLLEILMENPNIVLTRDRLLLKVWGYDFDGETRTVDVHIRTLRQKLGEAGKEIETVRGVGYCIRKQEYR